MTTTLGRTTASLALRPLVWLFHVALPLAGLWLLLGNPGLDLTWQDHVAHFWIVLATALLSVGLTILVAHSAHRHDDARLYLVAVGFTIASSFLAFHAFATPGVVVSDRSAAFDLTTPVGVAAAGVFAMVAAIDLTPSRAAAVLAWRRRLTAFVVVLVAAWMVGSLAPGSPLAGMSPGTIRAGIVVAAVVGIAGFGVAVVRGILHYRRQRTSLLLATIVTAQVLLAESLVAMAVAANWHLSWWLWHILMTIAFAYVAYGAYAQYQREGGTTTLFTSIVVGETLQRMRDDYAAALGELVAAIESARADTASSPDPGAIHATIAELQGRIGISEGQATVLEEAAEALAAERLDARRLGALAAIGRGAHLGLDEETLVADAIERLRAVFPSETLVIRLGEVPAGPDGATPPASASTSPHRLTIPLRSDDRAIGLLVAERSLAPFNERAERILESAANQLAVMIENGRLYRQVERLFSAYLSPDVVRTLLADPTQAGLGGAATEATVLFADLRGYTAYSVGQDPAAIVGLLNRYFGVAVPAILAEGGTVTSFEGDAIMAIFNAPVAQPEHPLRAARAALAMQVAIGRLVADDPGLPRFRIGIETGPVVVGNIGAAEVRAFTAIGQTTNLAARLQAYAPVGGVVLGPVTAARLDGRARLRPLGAIEFKGFPEPIEACELEGLVDD